MTIFDLYFSGIVAFQYHPANPPKTRLSLEDCAEVAIEMIKVRDRLLDQHRIFEED